MKIALPKGRLLQDTADMLREKGLEFEGYDPKSRAYRPSCNKFPDLKAKIFSEKDIPIQVAIGNYAVGICGLNWVEELLAKYPNSALVKVCHLGYGEGDIYACANKLTCITTTDHLRNFTETLRIATEYPNMAEAFAMQLRLKKFIVFPLWGTAEKYPPDCADIVLTHQASKEHLDDYNLVPLTTILNSEAVVIANKQSWESSDMSSILGPLFHVNSSANTKPIAKAGKKSSGKHLPYLGSRTKDHMYLALPDGHQQKHASTFLARASIRVENYSAGFDGPAMNLDGVVVKIIRPQDMTFQVANGNFDMAVTGQDWLYDHLYRFPTSPVRQLLNLGFGKVRIVAVVSETLPANTIEDLRKMLQTGELPVLRIASEYVNIADKFARDNHLSPCRLIPTWGATEAFLPEDADLLIENTETGKTLKENNLKIIDTLFESSACVIGKADSPYQETISSIVEGMKRGVL